MLHRREVLVGPDIITPQGSRIVKAGEFLSSVGVALMTFQTGVMANSALNEATGNQVDAITVVSADALERASSPAMAAGLALGAVGCSLWVAGLEHIRAQTR